MTTTAYLTDIAPAAEWEAHLAAKLVKRGLSADGYTAVYNYNTAEVQFKKLWDPITEASRGLVVDATTGEILARPFRKFFGFKEFNPQEQAAFLARTEPVLITDKLDGSLGILYRDPVTGEERIATRGSLTGEHAVKATKLYQELYAGKWEPQAGYTYLFEILMPGAGIVISYPEEELVLIGKVENKTGKSLPVNEVPEWPFKVTEVLPYHTLQEALEAPARAFKEGMVVHFLESDDRVKIKYEDFIRLHRIGAGISRYRVWEALASGVKMEEWKPFLEEEFYTFVDEVAAELTKKFSAIKAEAEAAVAETRAKFGETYERKDFAKFVNSTYSKTVASHVLNTEFNPQGASEQKLWDAVKPAKDFKA